MKKHNEGYALVLVLVVITVLCLVAMAMTAASLRNLKNQQDSIERMEAKYAAQGEIEKIVAEIESRITTVNEKENLSGFGDSFLTSAKNESGSSATYTSPQKVDGAVEFGLCATRKSLTVECKIKIAGVITESDGGFLIESDKIQLEYVSYTITEGGGS